MRLFPKLVLLLTLVATIPAGAQQSPSARVGRVSAIEGKLAFYQTGDAEWSEAKTNYPVSSGGWFATDPQSRAEFRIGPDQIWLAPDTQLNIVDLRQKTMELTLAQGRAELRVPRFERQETIQIDTPRGGVWLSQAGIFDVNAGTNDNPTRVAVLEGSARFVGGGVDQSVNAGETLVLTGPSDAVTAAVEPAVKDDFVRWCRSRDYHDRHLVTRVSPEMTGVEELDDYGSWRTVPRYGAVWYPRSVSADWAPYREGHWAWIEPWGWNWVDDEPWGFAPCHYGRWARIEDRWAWVPGEFVPEPVYAPALVAFIQPPALEVGGPAGGDFGPPVGWLPLAPGEIYWPSYTRDPSYIRNVNITNVSITRIANVTNIITARPAIADPPPQVANQRFANRLAATVVPSQVFTTGARIAPSVIAVPAPVLQKAAVSVRPTPAIAAPPKPTVAVRSQPTATTSSTGAPSGQPSTTGSISSAGNSPATVAGKPPIVPNFARLDAAPRVGPAVSSAAQPSTPVGKTPSTSSGTSAGNPLTPTGQPAVHQPPAGSATADHPAPVDAAKKPGSISPRMPATANVTSQGGPPPAVAGPNNPPAGLPPGPPDFSHLAPSRGSPKPTGSPAVVHIAPVPGGASPAALQPSAGAPDAGKTPPTTLPTAPVIKAPAHGGEPSAVAGRSRPIPALPDRPTGAPDFSHLAPSPKAPNAPVTAGQLPANHQYLVPLRPYRRHRRNPRKRPHRGRSSTGPRHRHPLPMRLHSGFVSSKRRKRPPSSVRRQKLLLASSRPRRRRLVSSRPLRDIRRPQLAGIRMSRLAQDDRLFRPGWLAT